MSHRILCWVDLSGADIIGRKQQGASRKWLEIRQLNMRAVFRNEELVTTRNRRLPGLIVWRVVVAGRTAVCRRRWGAGELIGAREQHAYRKAAGVCGE
ncbi:MAG TPA: hypothetical protein VJ728_02730 [Candidatus Binataceae bacterium]|nr:hypothetical protein [Candidatus Binataceae bacterium]